MSAKLILSLSAALESRAELPRELGVNYRIQGRKEGRPAFAAAGFAWLQHPAHRMIYISYVNPRM
ncbi:MAG: hypothetical protein Q7U85_03560 [Rhodocyclaceae bacterium]|nr:hypothetical protein [Rhodocyclaceae bacterium]